MSPYFKIFIETSVLLAASVYYGKGKYAHKEYDRSKSLFNLFSKNIKEQIGVISDTVIEQAKNTIEKVVQDVITETEGSDFKNKQSIIYYDILSKIKDNTEDRFRKNIKILTKMPTDEEEVNTIKTTEVIPFFQEVEKSREKYPSPYVSGVKLSRVTRKKIRNVNIPYYKSTPDPNDLEILADAIYIQRTFIPSEDLLFASLDTHFSPPRKDTVVRDKIHSKFKIFCGWPKEIYNKCKKRVK